MIAVDYIATEAIKRIAPGGFEALLTWWSGKQIVALGPGRTGKTSFIDALQYGIHPDEQPTAPTVKPETRRNFLIKFGRDQSFTLRIPNPRDTPGQVAPINQVRYIERFKPDGIVVILDATKFKKGSKSKSSTSWLTEFCLHLDALPNKDKSIARKLKTMIVVINKWDKLPQKDVALRRWKAALEKVVRSILDANLNNPFYHK